VYLLSYVLASRSSDVSSQFRRLQPDQLQLGDARRAQQPRVAADAGAKGAKDG
jgi:hypothetical protein